MEQRNLDFEIEMSRGQWEGLGKSAEASPTGDEGYNWDPDRSDEIRLFAHVSDVPELWRDHVTSDESYGDEAHEVARFHFNGGRPFASIEVPYFVDEPVYTEEETDAMRQEIESWVRGKWHALLRGSGLHYDRGHIPQDRGDRSGMWHRLRADGCEWEVRAFPNRDGRREEAPASEMLEFRCLDEERPLRHVAIEAGELDRANGPALLELFRQARPEDAHHEHSGERPNDSG